VLELSKQDKGGRKNWIEYSLASSNGAGGSGSQASVQASTAHQPAAATSSSSAAAAAAAAAAASAAHAHSTGYRDVTETPTQTHVQSHPQPQIQTQTQTTTPTTVESSPRSSVEAPDSPTVSTGEGYSVSRVRALHSFKPTEPNELAFERGDIIKVVNREYKDWWRGQLRGRTGIFPVNYVVRLRLNTTFNFTGAHVLVVFRKLFRNLPQKRWQPKHSRKLPCSRRQPTLISC
jgi:signal transducing adaptor molecule